MARSSFGDPLPPYMAIADYRHLSVSPMVTIVSNSLATDPIELAYRLHRLANLQLAFVHSSFRAQNRLHDLCILNALLEPPTLQQPDSDAVAALSNRATNGTAICNRCRRDILFATCTRGAISCASRPPQMYCVQKCIELLQKS